MLLIGFRPWLPDWAGYTLANQAATIGMVMRIQAMRCELELDLHPKLTIAGLVFFNLIFHFTHNLEGNGMFRYLFGQAEAIVLILWLAYSAYQVSHKHNSPSAMWIAVVYLLFDIPNILRWLQVLVGSTVPSSIEFDIVNVAILLLLSLTAVIGNIGFLGMFLEKANRQAIALAAQQARSEESASLMSQISQLDRRRSIGELAASLSHELSQPLNNIHLIAQTLEQQNLQRSTPDEKLSLFIQKILASRCASCWKRYFMVSCSYMACNDICCKYQTA
jgi:signal transduction histidine kinase